MDHRKILRRAGPLQAFRWGGIAVFALSLLLLFAASTSQATPNNSPVRGYMVPVQLQGQGQGTSYAVMTFRLQGISFVHYQEWGADANPWEGDPASRADYARRLISFVGYPKFSGHFTREEIEIENIQFFVPPDASAQAAQSACNLEMSGYQVWSVSGCAPPPAAAAQFSGRLEFSPSSPLINQEVTFSVSVEYPADPYAYFTYHWYVDGQLVEDYRRVPGTPYSAAQLARSFDTAGAHQVRVDVIHPSGATITLTQSPEVAALGAPVTPEALPSQPTESTPVSDRGINWESLLPLLWPLLLLILLKPLWRLLRGLLHLLGLIFSPFEQRAQAPSTKKVASDAGAVEEVPEEEGTTKAGSEKTQPVEEQEEEQTPTKKPAGELHKPLKSLDVETLQKALKSALDSTLSMLPAYMRESSPHASIDKFREQFNHRKLGPDFLEQYRDNILSAAKESNLTPEMIGAAVLTEQRELGEWEKLTDAAGAVLAVSEKVTGRIGKEASIGLCQRQVSSLIELGVHHDLKLEEGLFLRTYLSDALLKDKENLRIAGFFIRRLANQAADLATAPQRFGNAVHDFCAEAAHLSDKEIDLAAGANDLSQTVRRVMSQPLDKLYDIDIQDFAAREQIRGRQAEQALKTVDDAMALTDAAAKLASSYPELAAKAQTMRDAARIYKYLIGKPMQGFVNSNLRGHPLDFSVFKQPSINWTPAHVEFIGWKYNTGHLRDMDSITGYRDWGHLFLTAYLDIVKAGIFK